MENDTSKSQCAPVITRTKRFWESEQIGRIVNLLPEGGDLTIGRGQDGWRVDCQIEGKRIIKVETWDPGKHLSYVEDLLKKLKRLGGDMQHGGSDTRRNQAAGDGGVQTQGKTTSEAERLQAKMESRRPGGTDHDDG